MKKILLMTLTAAAIFIVAGCEQFSTSWQRVDDSELRMLDFIYEPADASPDDIINLTAVFAGKRDVDLDKYINWEISFNVIRDDLSGSATVIDPKPLDSVAIYKHIYTNHPRWPNAQVIDFAIRIPKDIMRTSKHIPDRWTDKLLPAIEKSVPDEFKKMDKNEIIDSLESLLENPREVADGGGGVDNPLIQNADYLPRLLQLFTVPIRVTAKIAKEPGKPGPHTIRSDHTVRYNRSVKAAGIKNIPSIPINRNPYIDDVVVYKVEGKNIPSFTNRSDLNRTMTPLHSNCINCDNVIEIEDGYTYFLEGSSGSRLDYSLTMSGTLTEEDHYAYWQFQLDSIEAKGVHHSEYMDIGRNMTGLARLTPPSNRRITKFTIWVTVRDEVEGELNRPQGSTLVEVSGRFVYK